MSGDALTEWQRDRWRQLVKAEDSWRWWAGVAAVGEDGMEKAQCALSTLRTMLRSEKQSVQVLIDNQVGAKGWENQYHYPDWETVLREAKVVEAQERR